MKVFVLSTMLFACVMAAPGVMENHVSTDFSFMKMISNCADSDDTATCLAVNGITALNRAARANTVEMFPGVTFTRTSSESVRAGKALSENEILSNLPAEPQEKNGRLLDLALESASNFLGSHNVQFTVPGETTKWVARAIETGRLKKVKKFVGPVLLAVAGKALALLPFFFGGVVLLVLKAVFVSKLALVLAAVLLFQKLSSGGSGGGFSDVIGKVTGGLGGGLGGGSSGGSWGTGAGASQGWSNTGSGSSASYPYARSYDEAQELAYKGQAPPAEQ